MLLFDLPLVRPGDRTICGARDGVRPRLGLLLSSPEGWRFSNMLVNKHTHKRSGCKTGASSVASLLPLVWHLPCSGGKLHWQRPDQNIKSVLAKVRETKLHSQSSKVWEKKKEKTDSATMHNATCDSLITPILVCLWTTSACKCGILCSRLQIHAQFQPRRARSHALCHTHWFRMQVAMSNTHREGGEGAEMRRGRGWGEEEGLGSGRGSSPGS